MSRSRRTTTFCNWSDPPSEEMNHARQLPMLPARKGLPEPDSYLPAGGRPGLLLRGDAPGMGHRGRVRHEGLPAHDQPDGQPANGSPAAEWDDPSGRHGDSVLSVV